MIIGVPKEIKNNENRVALTPAGVNALANNSHTIYVQKNAGLNSGFPDEQYVEQGAKILDTIEEVYAKSDIIVKVKEPLPSEYPLFKKGQTLFTYLHIAVDKELTKALLEKEVTGIAYETIQTADGQLPLLTPMSEVAGKMSVQIAANILEKHNGGSGVLLGGVAGVAPGKVAIVGGGIVGISAAKIAIGMGADVSILDVNLNRLREIENIFGSRIKTYMSNPYNLESQVKRADVLIGAVLIPGKKAPHLITEKMVKSMQKGSVIVDVAIDQGGIVETMDRITTHDNPTFEKHGVVHYSVANIPGAVARTSTIALTNATLSYLLQLANGGIIESIKSNPALFKGVNTFKGKLTNEAVAESLGLKYSELSMLIGF